MKPHGLYGRAHDAQDNVKDVYEARGEYAEDKAVREPTNLIRHQGHDHRGRAHGHDPHVGEDVAEDLYELEGSEETLHNDEGHEGCEEGDDPGGEETPGQVVEYDPDDEEEREYEDDVRRLGAGLPWPVPVEVVDGPDDEAEDDMSHAYADGQHEKGLEGLGPVEDDGVENPEPATQVAEELAEEETEDDGRKARYHEDRGYIAEYLPVPEPVPQVKAQEENYRPVPYIPHYETKKGREEYRYVWRRVHGAVPRRGERGEEDLEGSEYLRVPNVNGYELHLFFLYLELPYHYTFPEYLPELGHKGIESFRMNPTLYDEGEPRLGRVGNYPYLVEGVLDGLPYPYEPAVPPPGYLIELAFCLCDEPGEIALSHLHLFQSVNERHVLVLLWEPHLAYLFSREQVPYAHVVLPRVGQYHTGGVFVEVLDEYLLLASLNPLYLGVEKPHDILPRLLDSKAHDIEVLKAPEP